MSLYLATGHDGPIDNRLNSHRRDILVYQTAPLEHEIEVTGYPELTLFMASTALDTDITVRLIDVRPDGFAHEPRSHYAVAAAVAQGRADWGVTIETVAREMGLRFRPLRSESYDFVIPRERWKRPAVQAFRRVLEARSPVRRQLEKLGFDPPEDSPVSG